MSQVAATVSNFLVESLSITQRDKLIRRCATEHLEFGDVLYEAGQHYHDVYFPITGIISQVAVVKEQTPLEVGLIGNEGMLGASLMLGIDEVPLQAVVQGSGTALKMSVTEFKKSMKNSPALLKLLGLYLYVTTHQLAQATVCIHFHNIESRLARWLLMTHDRAHSDSFYLTHDFLAGMLGVRRSGISIAASTFQERKLISYTRGHITIVDRDALAEMSCDCYEKLKACYCNIMTV